MQLSSLGQFACPSLSNDSACHGKLELDLELVTPKHFSHDGCEIEQALIRCTSCGNHYPVLAGIPILVSDPWFYLEERYNEILHLTQSICPLSEEMERYLHSRIGSVDTLPESVDPYEQETVTNEYLCSHYDRIMDTLPPAHPARKALSISYQEDFYTTAKKLLAPHIKSEMLGLDIGCNVGRATHELTEYCAKTHGMDLSFTSLFAAQQVLRKLPTEIRSYQLRIEGEVTMQRQLPDYPPANITFAVGSADNLPYPDNQFDVVSNWNIIDRLPAPQAAIREQIRTTKPGGVMSLSTPYNWEQSHTPKRNWLGGTDKQLSIQAITELLEKGCDILDEKEYMPWVFRIFERFLELFYAYGVVARKHTQP